MRKAFFVLAVALFLDVRVLAQTVCTFQSITQTVSGTIGENSFSTIDGTAFANYIAFYSPHDYTGGNPDHNLEVFLYDSGTNTMVQVTSGNTNRGSRYATVNAGATTVAFMSDANLTGANPDLSGELFVYDIASGGTTQLTNSTGDTLTQGPFSLAVSGDASLIAFVSDADLVPPGNADHTHELFLFDRGTNTVRQITSDNYVGSDSIAEVDMSEPGELLVFAAKSDPLGTNPENNRELFIYDIGTQTLRQITNAAAGEALSATVDGAGRQVAFVSTMNLTGVNDDENLEIFIYDTATETYRQVTDTFGGFVFSTQWSDNGRRLFFASSHNLTGGNADGSREIFFYSPASNQFVQVTSSPTQISWMAHPNTDGTRLSIDSDANLDGTNPDANQEVFIATCAPDPPAPAAAEIPTASTLALLLLGAALVIVALLRL